LSGGLRKSFGLRKALVWFWNKRNCVQGAGSALFRNEDSQNKDFHRPNMAPLHSRISFSFGIALALLVGCLIYIPQWKHYAPIVHQSEQVPIYLTPWTVLFVTSLSLALALLSAPVQRQYPVLAVISKVVCALVLCSNVVFLLEYATGIRFPDLDIFFLPDATSGRISLYAARPSPNSAATSLFFSSALLVFRSDLLWRKRVYQILLVAALLLPTIAGVSYLGELLFARHAFGALHVGLSLPAVLLYFLLGSGTLGLSFRSRLQKAPGAEFRRNSVHPV